MRELKATEAGRRFQLPEVDVLIPTTSREGELERECVLVGDGRALVTHALPRHLSFSMWQTTHAASMA